MVIRPADHGIFASAVAAGAAGAGYFAGGETASTGSEVTTVDRFLFADDSRTTLGTGLSGTRFQMAGMASSVAGYFGGGASASGWPPIDAAVDRFLFADDSRTTLGTGLSTARKELAGMASSVAGYIAGGRT